MNYVEKYTSVGCNQTPESLDWGQDNLVIYAASQAVVVYNPENRRVVRTIAHHLARVNTVKWIASENPEENISPGTAHFISGSDDNTCIIYNVNNIHQLEGEVKTRSLVGHTGGIKAIDAKYLNGLLVVATASADQSVKIWINSTEKPETVDCIQTIKMKQDICFAVRIFTVKDVVYLAAASGDQILVFKKPLDGQFILIQTLVGHEDWVRGLDVITKGNEYLLVSSSQDAFIRIWRAEATTGETGSLDFVLESVLSGHDGWVYSVQWNLSPEGFLQLLSSSMDKSMILWELKDALWMERVRVGDIGGHFLGFYGAKMSPNKLSILGHGYHGSFHLWNQSQTDMSWSPGFVVGGHFGEVRDIAWDPLGEYLISVSADQTTRIHGPRHDGTWYEIARPQVHGYDMQVIAVLDRYRFASGAEEKIVRTFQAPSVFVRSLRSICGTLPDSAGDSIINSKSKSATLPTLGLSNQVETATSNDEEPLNDYPPTEETLMQNTLWPETQKLYGHGYEVFALAATSDGHLLASACKATNAEHAQIILWNTQTWKQYQQLAAHQLTVTQMKFSPNNRFLLSVSRDRKWALFENSSHPDFPDQFQLIAVTNKQNGIHGRIIWTCDWSHDSKMFATGSRDGKCVVWSSAPGNTEPDTTSSIGNYAPLDILEVKDSVTAIAFGKKYATNTQGNYLIAVGCETGRIHIFTFNTTWKELLILTTTNAHHLSVRKLAFRTTSDDDDHHWLASCGNDHFVRIYELNLVY